MNSQSLTEPAISSAWQRSTESVWHRRLAGENAGETPVPHVSPQADNEPRQTKGHGHIRKRGHSLKAGRFSILAAASVCVLVACACRDDDEPPSRQTTESLETTPHKPSGMLTFPDDMRVADESVNAFVVRAMSICGGGEYEPFRLLWSVREEPLPKNQFEEGWQAVEQIRVRALRKAMVAVGGNQASPGDRSPVDAGEADVGMAKGEENATGGSGGADEQLETVYLVLAEVRLDADHPAAKGRPQREVVLMLVQEHGQWRIAKPPERMRDWIREQAGNS